VRGFRWQHWAWLVAVALLATGIAALLALFPGTLDDREGRMRLVYLVLLLVLVGSGLMAHWRHRPSLMVRHLLIWIGVLLVLVIGYSYRFDLMRLGDRLTGELVPDRGIDAGADAVSFRAARDGHFHVAATVDGVPVRFMVDTGASTVALSPADAKRIGFDVERLSYTLTLRTASGIGRGAPVRLREVRIGPIVVRDVRAVVNRAEMDRSLLGMSLLERLSSYQVKDGTLTLRR
jgi:aspartyl protease family protein